MHIQSSELSIILFGVRVLSVSVTLFKPVKVLSRLCIFGAPNCPLYCLGFESSLFLLHFSNPRMYYQGCAYSVLRTVHYTVWGSSPFCICYTFQTRGGIIKAVHIKCSELSIILFGVRVLSVSVTLFKPAGVLSRLCILSALNCPLYCLGFESFLYLLHFSSPRMYIKAVHIKRSELSIILFGVRVLSVSVTMVTPFKPVPLYNSSENLKWIEILSVDIAPSPSVVLMLVQRRRRWININPCNAGIFL